MLPEIRIARILFNLKKIYRGCEFREARLVTGRMTSGHRPHSTSIAPEPDRTSLKQRQLDERLPLGLVPGIGIIALGGWPILEHLRG